jgi:twitching motility two-component system response regulator PilH
MKKILVIDDDKDFCYIIKRRLSDLGGYRVLIAKGNNMGRWIARCRWHKPDLILLDIMIPGIDGFGILERLKKDSITSAIPVIILSGKTEPESKKRAKALGCEDYIFKPVEAEALLDRIEKVLEKHY